MYPVLAIEVLYLHCFGASYLFVPFVYKKAGLKFWLIVKDGRLDARYCELL